MMMMMTMKRSASQKSVSISIICISLSEKYNERNLCYVSEERERQQNGVREKKEKVPCNEMQWGITLAASFIFCGRLRETESEREAKVNGYLCLS